MDSLVAGDRWTLPGVAMMEIGSDPLGSQFCDLHECIPFPGINESINSSIVEPLSTFRDIMWVQLSKVPTILKPNSITQV